MGVIVTSSIKTAKGAYVSWLLSHRSAHDIYGWARSMGVTNLIDPEEMHCTIIADPERALDSSLHGERYLTCPIELGAYHRPCTRILGQPGEDGALATTYDSDTLMRRHQIFRDRFGLQPTFPVYIPHISLSYDAHSQAPEVLHRLVNSPCRLPVVLNRERISHFD